jgi:hypothetical protein
MRIDPAATAAAGGAAVVLGTLVFDGGTGAAVTGIGGLVLFVSGTAQLLVRWRSRSGPYGR